MKQCKICFVGKPFSEFYTNGKTPNGSQKYKPSCMKCEEGSRRAFVEEKRKIIKEMFGESCAICGYSKCFAALEFHHVNPSDKENTPAKLINNFSSIERMIRELEKCIMVCANCHREIHHAGVVFNG